MGRNGAGGGDTGGSGGGGGGGGGGGRGRGAAGAQGWGSGNPNWGHTPHTQPEGWGQQQRGWPQHSQTTNWTNQAQAWGRPNAAWPQQGHYGKGYPSSGRAPPPPARTLARSSEGAAVPVARGRASRMPRLRRGWPWTPLGSSGR